MTENDWELDFVTHIDAACTQPLVTVTIAGPYALQRPSSSVSGAWEGQFDFATKTIRPEVDALRELLNGLEGCGNAPFETGVAQDVYETGCEAFGQYPRAVCMSDYDLVQVVDGALYFGARPEDNDMCSPERRPTEMSSVANWRQ
jgi:hypothetical protein